MENHSVNQLRMLRLLLVTLDLFTSIWSGFTKFAGYRNNLKDIIKKIDDELDIIAGVTQGPRKQKDKLRLQMIQWSLKISGAAYNYADDTGDSILLEKMDITKSDFLLLSDGEQANLAEMIYNTLQPLVTAGTLDDYNVVDADMVEQASRITKYRNFLSAPKASINDGSVARDKIRLLLKSGMTVAKKLDKLMEQYAEDEPDFYSKYFKARPILDLGHRYRKAISFVSGKTIDFDTDEVLIHVRLYFEGDEKHEVYSNEIGEYKIGAYQEGELLLISEKTGYITAEDLLTIKKGEDQDFNVEMEKEEPPLVQTPPLPEDI